MKLGCLKLSLQCCHQSCGKQIFRWMDLKALAFFIPYNKKETLHLWAPLPGSITDKTIRKVAGSIPDAFSVTPAIIILLHEPILEFLGHLYLCSRNDFKNVWYFKYGHSPIFENKTGTCDAISAVSFIQIVFICFDWYVC